MTLSPQAWRDRRVVLVAVFVAILLATAWLFLLGPGTRVLSPKGTAIAEFNGSGDQTTEPFAVRAGWQIHWSSESDGFSLAIRGDRNLGTVVDGTDAKFGVTTPPVGGTFHLEISAAGPWSVTVVQGD